MTPNDERPTIDPRPPSHQSRGGVTTQIPLVRVGDPIAASPRPVQVLLVTSSGCHFCREVDHLLEKLGQRFSLEVERIDLASERGSAIARRWRVPFPPVLLIEGEYHGHGRISERRLTRDLTRLIDREE